MGCLTVNLVEKIIAIYPELAQFDFAAGIITVADDGLGERLVEWEHASLPRPNEQEIAAIAVPYVPPPQSVTRYQAEVHMRRINLWDQADALFTSMDDADERKIAWLRAPTFNRESPALVYAAQQLGITDADLDQMFIDASKII